MKNKRHYSANISHFSGKTHHGQRLVTELALCMKPQGTFTNKSAGKTTNQPRSNNQVLFTQTRREEKKQKKTSSLHQTKEGL